MMIKSLVTLSATAMLIQSAAAVQLTSFEGAQEEFAGIIEAGTFITEGNGITDGSQALLVELPTGSGLGFEVLFSTTLSPDQGTGDITTIEIDAFVEGLTNLGFVQSVLGVDFGNTGFAFNPLTEYFQISGTKEPEGVGGNSFLGTVDEGQLTFTYSNASPAEFGGDDGATVFSRINSELAAGNSVDIAIALNKGQAVGGNFTYDNWRDDREAPAPTLRGDFDNSGTLEAADLLLLQAAV